MDICREHSGPTVVYNHVLWVLRKQTQAAWGSLGWPPAGAGSIFFQPGRSALSTLIQLETVNLSGCELRLNELLQPNVALLTTELALLVPAPFLYDLRPLLLLGHSFDGLLAYETVCLLNQLDACHPLALCISAHCAPMHRTPVEALHLFDDTTLIAGLNRFNGVPKESGTNAEHLAFCLPVIRADLQLDYQVMLRQDCSLHQSLLMMIVADDYVASPELMRDWLQMNSAKSAFLSWSRRHFYLHEQLVALCVRLHAFAGELWPPTVTKLDELACLSLRTACASQINEWKL